MSEISYMEKPEWISYDDIHELLVRAHESNREKGVDMYTAHLSGAELEKRIGSEGKCFVALDGDKLVGTASYRVQHCKQWYMRGPVFECLLAGVLPEYKGMHIFSKLEEMRFATAKSAGYTVTQIDTAEGNTLRQEIALKNGYRYVSYFTSPNSKHYSVVMLKWLGDCPFSERYCAFRFKLKRFLVRLRYKPGRIKRFGI